MVKKSMIVKKKKTLLKSKRKKKKWFKVISPEIYGKKDLGEITAFDSKELIGRRIKLSGRELVGSRDQSQKAILNIIKVRGEVAETEVIKSFIADGVVQKKSRKIKERIEKVFYTKLKSGETLKFKILLTTNNSIPRSTKSMLINTLPSIVENQVSNKTPDDIFSFEYKTNLSKEIKKGLHKIYPVSGVYVWKISLV